jgi:two-component system, NtrC family, sensor histidine kinase HydH
MTVLNLQRDVGMRLSRFDRWRGALAGTLIAVTDTLTLRALGMSFEIAGRDVSWLVAVWFGSSLALAGFLAGYALEMRRLIQEQMEQIAATRARLAQAERLAAAGELAAAITHEVRTPLAIIRSAAQSLIETLATEDAEARQACGFITDEIDRLANVVSSLSGFARPPQLRPRPVAIRELFDRALLLAREDLTQKRASVHRAEAAGLRHPSIDPDLMCQVLLCLLSNAAEAVPSGGNITLEATGRNGAIELAVADSGPGVPQELRERVFEPFFTTRSRGVGLGLAVARQIVHAHGGKMEVGAAPAGGARFSVRLPVESAAS